MASDRAVLNGNKVVSILVVSTKQWWRSEPVYSKTWKSEISNNKWNHWIHKYLINPIVEESKKLKEERKTANITTRRKWST